MTYKKPLIDFMDHAKLAFWTNKMIFQPTVAGSHNVDVVYGPEDAITPVVMQYYLNLGFDNALVVQRGRAQEWRWPVFQEMYERIRGKGYDG